jgi:hypothetical protein
VVWLGIVNTVVVCVVFGFFDGVMARGSVVMGCDRKGATNEKCEADGNGY